MNSKKSKSDNYSLLSAVAIGGVVLIPEAGLFRMYVAWEWENQAKNKFFAIIESPNLIDNKDLSNRTITLTASIGNDVTHKKEIQKLFPQLF